jgi:opacity protein-like surface antigen
MRTLKRLFSRPSVLVALFLFAPAVCAAQERFVVTVPMLNVRSEPSTASVAVARVPKDTALIVVGRSGDWVQVQVRSTGGSEVTGYVRGDLGRLEGRELVEDSPQRPAPAPDRDPNGAGPDRSAPVAVAAPAAEAASPPVGRIVQVSQPAVVQQPLALQPPKRTFGLGGRAGGFTFGVGGSVRFWSPARLGVQVDVSRYSIGSSTVITPGVTASAELTSWQIAPSLLYALGGADSDDEVWVRPYVGGGASFFRSSLSARASGFGESLSESQSETNVGFQGFGGAQMVFKAVPRLAISGDIGYYSTGTPFVGYQVGGIAFSIAGHWFVR